MEEIVRGILSSPMVLGDAAHGLRSDASLWIAGMDSAGCVALMVEVERQCRVEFPVDMNVFEMFGTIDAILDVVESLEVVP